MAMNKQSGFTLVELMAVIAIGMIILFFAVPNLQSMIQNHRVTSLTNSLVSSCNLARSEAVMRGVPVTICPAVDSSFTACGNDWSNGWIIFANPDGNAIFANNALEPLIRVKQVTGNGANITNDSNNFITYNSTGFVSPGTANTRFHFSAKGCSANHGRSVLISSTGKVTTEKENC